MIKLFNKLYISSILALASFFAFACSESNPGGLTGTAEEPNQTAHSGNANGNMPPPSSDSETESSSSTEAPIDNPDIGDDSSSSQTVPAPQSSSSDFGGVGAVDNNFLSIYASKAGITGVTFDKDVFGFNKTYASCAPSITGPCIEEDEKTAEFRTLGLHKITEDDFDYVEPIFPKTTKRYERQLKNASASGCPIYILNIEYTSPAWYILTGITSEAITVENIFDNCEYEKLPFDIHVGFLFTYCGELTDQTQIITNHTPNGSNKCNTMDYEEFYK
jgi:hypothetical protein